MPQAQLTWLKFGLAGVVVICGTVLVAFGKLDPATMFHDVGTTISVLIGALGLSAAASTVREAQEARLAAVKLERQTAVTVRTP